MVPLLSIRANSSVLGPHKKAAWVRTKCSSAYQERKSIWEPWPEQDIKCTSNPYRSSLDCGACQYFDRIAQNRECTIFVAHNANILLLSSNATMKLEPICSFMKLFFVLRPARAEEIQFI